jgi:hypothetical protein
MKLALTETPGFEGDSGYYVESQSCYSGSSIFYQQLYWTQRRLTPVLLHLTSIWTWIGQKFLNIHNLIFTNIS